MSSPLLISLIRRVCVLSGAAILAAVSAGAQSSQFFNAANQVSSDESSSSAFPFVADSDPNDPSGATALHAAAASLGSGKGSGAGQPDQGGGHGLFSKLAFEAGGGANAPAGYSSNYITWGGNFTVGGGLHFSRGISLLAEYQFLDDKLPGNLIAETGANGGDAHIWSLTIDPVIDLLPKAKNSVYITGGGGFYRKVTNFTDPEEAEYCDYYYCGIGTENAVVGHFSSNQGGWNIGGGFTHRVGGVYDDSRMKLFAEVRYLDVMSPASQIAPNGLGTATVSSGTKLIPVTLGVRW
ncbi:MAG: hypothetical protein ABSG96_13665 [Terracidiphilus sp.]|jgi:hypothetical protein